MPVVVKHKKVSEVPDSADETIIQPSDWNDEHEISGAVSLEEFNARVFDITPEDPSQYPGHGYAYAITSNGTVWNPGAFRVSKYTGVGIPAADVLQMTDTGGRLSSGDPVNNFNTVNKRHLEQATPTYRGILPVEAHDLNTYRDMGYWVQDRNVGAEAGLNYPLNKAGFLEVFAGYSSNVTTVQRYTAYNDAKSYIRMEGIPGTWSAWQEIYSSGNLPVYTGSSSSEVNFPVGHYVAIITPQTSAGEPELNSSVTVRLSGTKQYSSTGSGAILSGTWRARGKSGWNNNGVVNYLMQRTA